MVKGFNLTSLRAERTRRVIHLNLNENHKLVLS